MNGEEIAWLSALELRALYRARELSPVAVAEATLARIDALDPTLAAFVTTTPERALSEARRSERALMARHAERPLEGIPISLKDLVPTRGVRTTRGSLLYEDWVPDFDAPVAERVRDAGAVLLGKTNTPEMGWKGDSGNRVLGPTHNPFAHGRTAGGSSGGAAAAVAAGLGPLAQGSDGAGSIRIPAAFCGVFGHKPSFGLVPYHPPSAIEQLSAIGPITRTVRDAALLLDVIAGPDARDRMSLPATGTDFLAGIEGGVRGMRVAWSDDLGFGAVEPEVLELARAAAGAFDELGAHVEEISAVLSDPYPALELIWATGQAAMHDGELDAVRDRLDPGRLALIEVGLEVSGVELAAANAERLAFYQRVRELMGGYDLLLTPTLPVTAFAAGDDHPPPNGDRPASVLGWTCFTYPFNMTGHPAATVPAGLAADGLPVGLQIVGGWREDATVLRAAAAYEELRPWLASLAGADLGLA